MSASHNARWAMASQSARVLGQLAGVVILSRILLPKDFGEMAMAMTAMAFASMLRELGISSALIQKLEVDSDDITTAFYSHLVLSGIIATVLFVTAYPLAKGLGSPSITPLLKLLSLTFPLAGLSAIQQALMERRGRFQALAVIEITATVLGLALAIAMANCGYGIYSLVFQSIAVAGIGTVGLWLAGSPVWLGQFQMNRLKTLLDFGGNLTLFNLINFFSRNADNILIGRQLGQESLGVYSQAYKIMLFPVQNLTLVVGRALYPNLCLQQDKPIAFWNQYLKATRMIATLSAPLLLGIAIYRFEFVNLIFGPRWSAIPALLLWLSLTGCIQSLVSLTGTVLMAKGMTRLLFWTGLFSSITQVSSFFLGVHWGLNTLVKLYFAANLINAALIIHTLIRACHGTHRSYIKASIPSFAIAGITFWAPAHLIPTMTSPLHQTVLSCCISILAYTGCTHAFLPERIIDFREILDFRSKSPKARNQ